MFDGQIVGVRENVSLESALAQFRVQRNHRWNLRKDVGKITTEFREIARVSEVAADGFEKSFARQQAALVLQQQWRGAEESMQIFRRFGAARSDFSGRDRVIKVHQDFAEVEDESGRHD